jgi:hypothetical protein
MTTADLLALIERAGHKLTFGHFRTWVVAQSVRNALQTFHGGWAFDPDNPGSGEGFISDGQMRALNITIRQVRLADRGCLPRGSPRQASSADSASCCLRRKAQVRRSPGRLAGSRWSRYRDRRSWIGAARPPR